MWNSIFFIYQWNPFKTYLPIHHTYNNNYCMTIYFIHTLFYVPLRIYWLYPGQRGKPPPTGMSWLRLYLLQRRKTSHLTKRSVLAITLNCIWWWGDLGSVGYPFIDIISRFTLTCSCLLYRLNRFVLNRISHINYLISHNRTQKIT